MELHKFKLKISRTHINPLLEDLTLYLEDINLTKIKHKIGLQSFQFIYPTCPQPSQL
jgi:hypothetical protein